MKNIIYIVLLISGYGCSQKVTVSGNVSAGRFKEHLIVLNDTFVKYESSGFGNLDDANKLYFSNKFHTVSDRKGNFSIKAKRTDSLYFYSRGYKKQAYLADDLIRRDTVIITLEEYPCDTVKCKEIPKYFIVGGSKVTSRNTNGEICPSMLLLGSRYEAKYKIIDIGLDSTYQNENIIFTVSVGHYPDIFEHKDAVLFISESCGKYHLWNGNFIDIYKTADGRWASPYSIYNKSLTPEPMAFQQTVVFSVKGEDRDYINKHYPSPYYKIEGNKAIAVYGYYLPELLEAKKAELRKYHKVEF